MEPRDLQVLKDMEREVGRDAVRTNIYAALAVSETLKSSLGPRGMDKMLVTKDEIVITDSGATILKLMNLVHPAAKLMATLGKTQGEQFGDGSTTAVVIAGELLKKALELMDAGLHANTIINGYRMALKKSLEFLDSIGLTLEQRDMDRVGLAMLRGKIPEKDAWHLIEVANAAVNLVRGEKERIYINYRPGGSIRDTYVFDGIYIDLGKRVHPSMPRTVKNAKIMLIDREFDLIKISNSKVEISSARDYRRFLEYKKQVMKRAVDIIASSGANVVLCSKNIAEEAMYFLAKAGILGVRDVEKDVLKHTAEATGAKVLVNIKEVRPEVLGYAGYIEESKIGLEEIMYIRKPKYPNRVASILIRAGSENLALELVRKMKDLIEVLCRVAKERKILPGGGATEVEVAERLKMYARRVPSREQLAIKAYAEALEEIPKVLARNAGMKPVDVLASIRRGHYAGFINVGFNAITRKVQDNLEQRIFDSYPVKRNAFISATEVATAILKIDDVFVKRDGAKKKKKTKPAPKVEPPITPEGKFDLRYAFKGLR